MSKMEIFEPAMCCETGLCGVSIDLELLRISTAIRILKERGIKVERYNLSNAPQAFVDHKVVNDFINQYGVDNLPVVLVDGEIKAIGHYPSNEEFIKWLELSEDVLGVSKEDSSNDGCCKGGCC